MKRPTIKRVLAPRKHPLLPTDYQWLVLTVPPTKERLAENMLSGAGLTIFLPTEMRMRRVSRRAKRRELREYPTLPGYLFLGIRDFIPWYDIHRYTIIQTILGLNGSPICLEEEAMLKMLGAIAEKNAPPRQIAVGDHCRVLSGPFVNHRVRIEEIKGESVKIIISLFGGETPAQIHIEKLQLAA